MNPCHDLIQTALLNRLTGPAADFCKASCEEIAAGVSDDRFSLLLAKASRFAPRTDWAPDESEIQRAGELLPGWSPERWSILDTLRVLFVLSRTDLAEPSFEQAIEEAFRYTDEGESCALFRAIPLCPNPERFLWRVSDGCRTNMTSVFESIAFDSPFPVTHFDDVAWNQLVIKGIFIGVNLARVYGLDERLSPELARIALDLVEERRSAGRDVQTDLWMTIGTHGGKRGLDLMELELKSERVASRCGAALALARAGEQKRLEEVLASESDPLAREIMTNALAGNSTQLAFEQLNLSLQETN